MQLFQGLNPEYKGLNLFRLSFWKIYKSCAIFCAFNSHSAVLIISLSFLYFHYFNTFQVANVTKLKEERNFWSTLLRISPWEGIQDSLGFWIPCHGFWNPGTGFQSLSVKLGFWIPWAAFGIPSPRILDFTSKTFTDSGFHKQKFPVFQNPDSLTLDNKKTVQVLQQHMWTLPVVQHQGNNRSLHQQKISPQRGKLSSSWCRDMHSKLLLPLSRQPWAEWL